MPIYYIESERFTAQDYTAQPLPVAEYYDCDFSTCNFAGTDLSQIVFENCSFEGCDLSNAKLKGTAFKTVQFRECKLLGLQFDDCNPFQLEMVFQECVLDYSIFYKLKLRSNWFGNCQLHKVDFTEADLSNARFDGCDLAGAVFEATNLEGADFRTATNYRIDPESNRLKKARFSSMGLAGLLGKYGIVIEEV